MRASMRRLAIVILTVVTLALPASPALAFTPLPACYKLIPLVYSGTLPEEAQDAIFLGLVSTPLCRTA
jgi:hypothetical protein